MKTPLIALACIALLTAGCIHAPSPYSSQLNPATERYHAVKKGTSRVELEAQFGQPARTEKDGSLVWETRFDELNYATLKVWFGADDQARQVEVTQAHGEKRLGYYASASNTRSK